MPYLDQFMQQWKAHLQRQLSQCGGRYAASDVVGSMDIKVNSLAYFRCLRTTSGADSRLDESRDEMAWVMLNRQLTVLAKKAEKGTFDLVSKWHIEENQIQIRLNFSYDAEQHIVYVS